MFIWVSNNLLYSCLVWCSFKEHLQLYAASFQMIVFNAWIIICRAHYPVWLVHTFSSYMHCWESKAKRL